MPKYRLRSYDQSPPGSYFYEQPPPNYRRFGPEPMIESVARQLQGYRVGNKLPRASYSECLQDVDAYLANNVLKGNPTFTVLVNESEPAVLPLQADAPGLQPCRGCGAPVSS